MATQLARGTSRAAPTKDKTSNTFRYKMVKGRKTPMESWLSDGNEWPELQKIAVELSSITTSSVASERNFSTTAFIHSKLRNSPSVKSVEKLVLIKSNIETFASSKI